MTVCVFASTVICINAALCENEDKCIFLINVLIVAKIKNYDF